MTPPSLSSGLSGRDHYAGIYASDLDREAAWLRASGLSKAESVEILLRPGRTVETVLEIGAGTGAVITALRRRGVGTRHFAVDFSDEALAHLRQTDPAIETATADVTVTPNPFDEPRYDVAIVSHVVEHLEAPGDFLRALRAVPFERLIVEVPLEDLPAGRLKARFRDRMDNEAGHVQFFDRASLRRLVSESGYAIRAERLYAPVLNREALSLSNAGASRLTRIQRSITRRWLPLVAGPLLARVYHAHFAVLLERA